MIRVRRGFGGGWLWKIGVQGSRSRVVVSLVVFEVTLARWPS